MKPVSVRRLIAHLAFLPLLAGCASAEALRSDAPAPPMSVPAGGPAPTGSTTTLPPPQPTTSTSTLAVVDAEPAITWTAAKANGQLAVYQAPDTSRPFRTLDSHTILGTPTVVLVLRGSSTWLEVLLPGRPNGETGWIRAADVETFEVARQVVVDLRARTLQVLEGDELIFETPIGIGSPSSPTPTGTFFVTDAVRITNPSGPWGPYAFGLSARSDTVTEFNGGDGIIGIHGTNRPRSIGEAQSLGCVRLANDVMLEVAKLISVGSPVTIKA